MSYKIIKVPSNGEKITFEEGKLNVPNHPIIPFIEGDGIGGDITKATLPLLNKAVEKAYNGKRSLQWMEIFAGEKAYSLYNEYLPKETLQAIKDFIVALKGPLTTPIGGGFRSLNVTLRQTLDLYACVRPVRYFNGVVAPVKEPQKLDVVIFRENTEDVYSGIEWEAYSDEANAIIHYLKTHFHTHINESSAIGIKPISEEATKRLVRSAITYMIQKKRRSLTLVHKGNIMKYTEGAFKTWGYEVALEEYRDIFVSEDELYAQYDGKLPEGKFLVKDRIADSMFQQVLLRPDEYDVIALPNLNGDYLSDACAAQVGGIGLAPGANIGDYIGLFEATHGTAPKHANKNKVNPSSLILSGVMMLDYMGWPEAADMITKAIEKTIQSKVVTYDLARLMNIEPVSTSEFAEQIQENL